MRKLILLLYFCFVSFSALAQDRIITGTVLSNDDNSSLPGVNVVVKGTTKGTQTDMSGNFSITLPNGYDVLVFMSIGMKKQVVTVGKQTHIIVKLESDDVIANEVVITGYSVSKGGLFGKNKPSKKEKLNEELQKIDNLIETSQEEYAKENENSFEETLKRPLSTFSIDVDVASYSNMRRFINLGKLPPIESVRIEEMINYFDYEYPQPTDNKPFTITSELSNCPWNKHNYLLHLGLQGKKIAAEKLPASNLVFLLDVSGSMNEPNKLPLLVSAFSLLVDQLRSQDKVAIVVYAGAAGVVLKPTSGNKKETIKNVLENLSAGGSTAGGEGIKLAYELAKDNFVMNGNNRVIIATDGDFNVGISSETDLENFITKKREEGVFLTVLGFGTGNYKDSRMELLADKGNGNYAYIDNITEAQKVLVNEFGGTLFTIAKDVKIQLEPKNLKRKKSE